MKRLISFCTAISTVLFIFASTTKAATPLGKDPNDRILQSLFGTQWTNADAIIDGLNRFSTLHLNTGVAPGAATALPPNLVTNGDTMGILKTNGSALGGVGFTNGTIKGNLTGNLVGNVTGNLTGNADTASAASALSLPFNISDVTVNVNPPFSGILDFSGFSTGLKANSFIGSGASLTALNAANISSGTLSASRLPAFSGDASSSAGSSTLTLATVATPGTATKVTYSGKGLITSTNPLTLADLPAGYNNGGAAATAVSNLQGDNLNTVATTNNAGPVWFTNEGNTLTGTLAGDGLNITDISGANINGYSIDIGSFNQATQDRVNAGAGSLPAISSIFDSGWITPTMLLTNDGVGPGFVVTGYYGAYVLNLTISTNGALIFTNATGGAKYLVLNDPGWPGKWSVQSTPTDASQLNGVYHSTDGNPYSQWNISLVINTAIPLRGHWQSPVVALTNVANLLGGDGSRITALTAGNLTGTLPVSTLPATVVTNTTLNLNATNATFGTVTNSSLTANALAATDGNKKMVSVTMGSGLTYSAGTLAATAQALPGNLVTNNDAIGILKTAGSALGGVGFTNGVISGLLNASNVVGLATNSIVTVNTNFQTGVIGVNNWGVPIVISANALLTAATAAGMSQLSLEVPGVMTNRASESLTVIAALTGTATNGIASITVPPGGTWLFRNTSTAGSAAAGWGQINYINALSPPALPAGTPRTIICDTASHPLGTQYTITLPANSLAHNGDVLDLTINMNGLAGDAGLGFVFAGVTASSRGAGTVFMYHIRMARSDASTCKTIFAVCTVPFAGVTSIADEASLLDGDDHSGRSVSVNWTAAQNFVFQSNDDDGAVSLEGFTAVLYLAP